MYNEPFRQIFETIVGVYRNIFELYTKEPLKFNEKKLNVCIIADGIENL